MLASSSSSNPPPRAQSEIESGPVISSEGPKKSRKRKRKSIPDDNPRYAPWELSPSKMAAYTTLERT